MVEREVAFTRSWVFRNKLSMSSLVAALAAFSLVGCGGGGSTDSTPTAEGRAPASGAQPVDSQTGIQPPSINYTDVALTLTAPTSTVVVDLEEGHALPTQSFNFKASGNLENTNATELRLLIEDSNLFLSDAGVQAIVNEADETIEFKVPGNLLTTVGKYEGVFTLYACADEKCKTQYQGSPYKIPYKVNVRSGIVVSTSQVTASAPFGTKPESQTVEIALPSDLKTDNIRIIPFNLPDAYYKSPNALASDTVSPISATLVKDPISQKASVKVDFAAAHAGTYSSAFDVAVVANGINDARNFEYTLKRVNIRYTATSDGITRYVVDPKEISFTSGYFPDSNAAQGSIVRVYVDKGVEFDRYELDRPTIKYLSNPDLQAANDHPLVKNWFDAGASLRFGVRQTASGMSDKPPYQVCTGSLSDYSLKCLPAGIYTGLVSLPVVIDGALQSIEIPVTMKR